MHWLTPNLPAAYNLLSEISTERVETLMPYLSGSGALLLVTFLGIPALTNAAENIDMSKVRALAALPVKEIFRDSPVRELPRASYWKTIRESPIPVVVMFYSNVDSGKMVLEDEQYIAANFKEFRTPSLLFWKVYYNTACSYIDKNILD